MLARESMTFPNNAGLNRGLLATRGWRVPVVLAAIFGILGAASVGLASAGDGKVITEFGLSSGVTMVVVGLIVAILLIAFWSRITAPGILHLGGGLVLDNVYLSAMLGAADQSAQTGAPDLTVHVRRLDVLGAKLICPKFLPAGARYRLGVSGVAGMERQPEPFEVEVIRCRRWRGARATWVADVRFVPVPRGSLKDGIVSLIRAVGGQGGRLAHA